MLLVSTIVAGLGALASAGPLPPTCVSGLRAYGGLRDVPAPYVALPLTQPADAPRPLFVELLDQAARQGATGYLYVEVPDSIVTPQERRAMRTHAVRARPYRTLAVFVPADSARARRACEQQPRRILRSY